MHDASRRRGVACIGAALALLVAACPMPVRAAVYYGFGFGVPLIVPPVVVRPPVYYPPAYYPPAYYPPPAYYAPPTYIAPPGYVPPGAVAPRSPGYAQGQQSCIAEAYRCPMDRPTTPGAACYCPGNGGQRVWGHAK